MTHRIRNAMYNEYMCRVFLLGHQSIILKTIRTHLNPFEIQVVTCSIQMKLWDTTLFSKKHLSTPFILYIYVS